MRKKVLTSVFLAATLSACAVQQPGQQSPFGISNTTGGMLIGAGSGGLIGSQIGKGSGKTMATLAGVLLGGLAGHQIGAALDRRDQEMAQQAMYQAGSAPVGTQVQWQNPANGHAGTYVATREGYGTQLGQQMYCREFQQTIVINGQQQQGYGNACRQPDGSWKVLS